MNHKETDVQKITREKNFTYHPPTGKGQVSRYTDIRQTASDFARVLNGYCPPSRELSLAMTKLEECVMWANAAIARNEIPE